MPLTAKTNDIVRQQEDNLEKGLIYQDPEFRVTRYNGADVLTASEEGSQIVDPLWGGEVVPFISL